MALSDGSGAGDLPVTTERNCSVSALASAAVCPLTAIVIIDADAFEIAQPVPTKRTSAEAVAVHLDPHRDLVAAERVASLWRGRGVREWAVVPGRPVVVEDDALIELAQVARRRSLIAGRSWARLTGAAAAA